MPLRLYRSKFSPSPRNPLKQRHSASLANPIDRVQQHVLCSFVLLRLYHAANYQFNGTIFTSSIAVHCVTYFWWYSDEAKQSWRPGGGKHTFTAGTIQVVCLCYSAWYYDLNPVWFETTLFCRARFNFCRTLCDFGTRLQCHWPRPSEHGLPSPHFIFTTMRVSLLLLQPCLDKLQILDPLDSSVKVMLWEMMSVTAASDCCCTAWTAI